MTTHGRARVKWTDDENERLLARAASGAMVQDMASEFGRSREAITQQLRKLTNGVTRQPTSRKSRRSFANDFLS